MSMEHGSAIAFSRLASFNKWRALHRSTAFFFSFDLRAPYTAATRWSEKYGRVFSIKRFSRELVASSVRTSRPVVSLKASALQYPRPRFLSRRMIRILGSSTSSGWGQGTSDPSSIISVSMTGTDCDRMLCTAESIDPQWFKHGITAEIED